MENFSVAGIDVQFRRPRGLDLVQALGGAFHLGRVSDGEFWLVLRRRDAHGEVLVRLCAEGDRVEAVTEPETHGAALGGSTGMSSLSDGRNYYVDDLSFRLGAEGRVSRFSGERDGIMFMLKPDQEHAGGFFLGVGNMAENLGVSLRLRAKSGVLSVQHEVGPVEVPAP